MKIIKNIVLVAFAIFALIQVPVHALDSETLSSSDKKPSNFDCPDHMQGEILIKLSKDQDQELRRGFRKLKKTKRGRKKHKILKSSLVTSTGNDIDENVLREIINQQIPDLQVLEVSKLDDPDDNSTLIQSSLQLRSKQLKPKRVLNDNYGFDRTFKIKVDEQNCHHLTRLIKRLRENDAFELVQMNSILRSQDFDDTFLNSAGGMWDYGYSELWGLEKISAQEAWEQTMGEGVIVAVIDSGVDYNHPDLWGNIWIDPLIVSDVNNDGQVNLDDVDLNHDKFIQDEEIIEGMFGLQDYVDKDSNPMDLRGHGTHVAGTIAAMADNHMGIAGVAPGAKILIVRILDKFGGGDTYRTARAVKGLAELVNEHPYINRVVTNSSIGFSYKDSVLENAYDFAQDAGLVNLVAAGNENSAGIEFSPASFASTISVASTTTIDTRSSFSNFGSNVDIAAPGGGDSENAKRWNIISTMPVNSNIATEIIRPEDIISFEETNNSFAYVALAGTSMATPHAAGVAALILAKNPNLTPLELRAAMRYSADKVDSASYIGAGRVNAYSAVNLQAIPPLAQLNQFAINGSTAYYFNGQVVVPFLSSDFAVVGTVKANDLYTAELTHDGQVLASIDSDLIDTNLANGIDFSALPFGKLELKLSVTDNHGLMSEDSISAFVENIVVQNPKSNDVLARGNIDLRAKLLINDFDSFSVEYKKSNEDIWSDEFVTSYDIDPFNDEFQVFASLNGASLDADDFYDIRLHIARTNNPDFEQVIRSVYLSSQFKPGFPVQMDRTDLDNYATERRDAVFYSNLSSHQAIEVADLDGDGLKEIITKNVFHPFSMHDPMIQVHSHNGNLLWTREFPVRRPLYLSSRETYPSYDSVDQLAIVDLNGDGRKEIITDVGADWSDFRSAISISDLIALDFQGEMLNGWPLYLDLDIHGEGSRTTLVADIDHDGTQELILKQNSLVSKIAGQSKALTIVDTSVPRVKRRIVVPFCSYYTKTARVNESISVGNFDSDPDLEIVTQYGCNQIAVYNQDGSLVPGWPFTPRGHVQAGFSVADLDNDGFDEISFTTINRTDKYRGFKDEDGHNVPSEFLNQRNQIYILDKSANILEGWPVYLGREELDYQDGPHEGDFTLPVFVDIDNDGDLEISLPCQACEYQQYLFHHDGTNVEGWPLNLIDDPRTSASYSSIEHKQYMNTIADINNDGKLDIINIAGGSQFQEPGFEDYSRTGGVFAWNSNGSLIDLNPHPDINALVIEYDSLKDNQGQSVIIDDLDGDHKLDIIYANQLDVEFRNSNAENNISKRRSSIYAWSLDSEINNASVAWSRVGGNLENTYRVESSVDLELKQVDLFPKLLVANDTVQGTSKFVVEFQARSRPGVSIYSAYNVIGELVVPDGFEFIPEESVGCSIDGNKVTCSFSRIDAGKMKRRYLSFRAPDLSEEEQFYFRDAKVASHITGGSNFTVDPTPNQKDFIQVTVIPFVEEESTPMADMIQRLSVDKPKVTGGDVIEFIFKAISKPESTHSAYNVIGQINVPDGFEFLSEQSNRHCKMIGSRLECKFYRIDADTRRIRKLKFRVPTVEARTAFFFSNVFVESRLNPLSPKATIDPVADTRGRQKIVVFP